MGATLSVPITRKHRPAVLHGQPARPLAENTKRFVGYDHRLVPTIGYACEHPRDGIRNVVMSARRMVHSVLASPARSALKPSELRDHARSYRAGRRDQSSPPAGTRDRVRCGSSPLARIGCHAPRNRSRGHSPAYRSPDDSSKCDKTSALRKLLEPPLSGEKGAFRSTMQSRTARSPSRCAIASVMASSNHPRDRQSRNSSRRQSALGPARQLQTQASIASRRKTNTSRSPRNSAPYSALAASGSASSARSTTRCGRLGFIVRLGAFATRISGSPLGPKWRLNVP